MGKTDLNTACSPISSRRSAGTSFCRNVSYDRFCTSMRFGISTIDGIFPKSRRLRRPHCIVPAMMSPELRGFVRPLACPRPRLRDLDGGPLLLELILDLLRLRLGDLLL